MYAKITKDLLFEQYEQAPDSNRTDVVLLGREQPAQCEIVRLLDDDRIPYYEAIADDEALELLFEWAMRDSGVTILQTWQDREWVDVMS